MSFSLMMTAWPFLLGAEAGTVPLGSAARNKLPSNAGKLFRRTFVSSFRPLVEEITVEYVSRNTKSIRDFGAMDLGFDVREILEREREILVGFYSGRERESD